MRAPWRRKDPLERLEADLREQRPQPPPQLFERIAEDAGTRRSRRAAPRPRFGLALAACSGFVATVVALGGVGAPLDGARGVFGFDAAKSNAPAQNQYVQQATICHRPPGNPSNARTLRVGQPAVAAHLRNHPDSTGPCP